MAKPGIEVIYEDNDIIVINKPSGVSVTADRSGDAELIDILAEQFGPQETSQLRLVHRLDKHTSGVMILALNPQAQSVLSSYFERKVVKKTYLALVTGVVPGPDGTIDAPLAHNPKKAQLMSINRKKGKAAVTNWRLLADFGTIALLAVNPLAGRTHQIRVHLPSVGLPLAIDPLYGSSKPLFLSDFKPDYRLGKDQIEKPLMDRLTLHAYQLELPPLCHSEQSEESHLSGHSEAKPKNLNHESRATSDESRNLFVAGLDKKFSATIKMLTKHNPKGLDAFVNPDDFLKIINTQRLC
ncbi:MAG: RluA family pseudouridine synthase [Planctomycetota bacterium]|jgi:RluA family pseudouridine synthase